MGPSIEFINHAGVLIQCNDVVLVQDPWIDGAAFNNGWDLIAPSTFSKSRFDSITHIWFSHEHPDHFSPPLLREIPKSVRPNITVLFQKTKDRRVVSFCESLGFLTLELADHKWVDLGVNTRIFSGRLPLYDSWLMCDFEGYKILNINDCILDSKGIMAYIKRRCGPCDVLLTQFAYANWAGNPEDGATQKRLAESVLARIEMEISVFEPKWLIPFASFIHFSHTENRYLNEHNNSASILYQRLGKESMESVIMAPGDVWYIGKEWTSNETNLLFYELKRAESNFFHKSESIPIEKIFQLSSEYMKRIRGRNNMILISVLQAFRYFSPICIELWDVPDCAFTFDLTRGLTMSKTRSQADVKMHSDSLAFLLKFDYGIDTLLVNGRFRATQASYKKMLRLFSLGSLNNGGRFLNFWLIGELKVLWWAIRKLYMKFY